MFDRHGVIVARTHAPERFVGQRGAPALDAAMQGADTGMVETATLESVRVLAAFTRSTSSGWAVAVGVPKQALLAKLQRWVAWLAAASVLLLAVAAGLASYISARLTRAIAALEGPAAALGRGEPVDLQPQPLREVNAVADAMRRASRLLESRTRERDRAHDATEAALQEAARMEHAARHDGLTGLANRALFVDQLCQAVEVCAEQGAGLAVFFVDMDDFKVVNDRHGHLVGDELLRDFAARLAAGVRDSDLPARLGGDEFAVLLRGTTPAEAETVAATLVQRLSAPFGVHGLALQVSACIGVATCPADGLSAQALLAAADVAMYRAKARGKARHAMASG